MQPFTRLTGIAAPLLRANIDTDIIIPSREIVSPERTGFGARLFAPWRYLDTAAATPDDETRIENPEFVLNREPFRHARILLAGENFGCGSSREMAVWALLQFGIRCVIAPSFGAIFRRNCVRNGLLPIELGRDAVDALAAEIAGGANEIDVDLAAQTIRCRALSLAFAIDAADRRVLLAGLDPIAETLQQRPAIEAFHARDRQLRPWAWAIAGKAHDAAP